MNSVHSCYYITLYNKRLCNGLKAYFFSFLIVTLFHFCSSTVLSNKKNKLGSCPVRFSSLCQRRKISVSSSLENTIARCLSRAASILDTRTLQQQCRTRRCKSPSTEPANLLQSNNETLHTRLLNSLKLEKRQKTILESTREL